MTLGNARIGFGRELAKRARDPEIRAQLLVLAEQWLALARKSTRTARGIDPVTGLPRQSASVAPFAVLLGAGGRLGGTHVALRGSRAQAGTVLLVRIRNAHTHRKAGLT